MPYKKHDHFCDRKTKMFVNFLCNYFGSGEPVFDIFIIIFDKSTKLLIHARKGA